MLFDFLAHLTCRECKEKRDILRLRAAEAAVAAGEPALAMHHVRQVCATWPGSAAVWNVLCQATITVPSMLRQAHRTVAVQALEAEESLAMRLINGHCQAIDVSPICPTARYTYSEMHVVVVLYSRTAKFTKLSNSWARGKTLEGQ